MVELAQDELVHRLRAQLSRRPDLAAAWLFGSRARGTAGATSDVDVGVLFRRPLPGGYDGWVQCLDLADDLTRALGVEAQVVDFETVPADLNHRILRDGVLLLDADPSRRIQTEVRRRNEYFDLVPMWRQLRRFGGAEP